MTSDEVTLLGTYNAERSRGLIHAPHYQERMAALQQQFDTDVRVRLMRDGWREVSPGAWVKP